MLVAPKFSLPTGAISGHLNFNKLEKDRRGNPNCRKALVTLDMPINDFPFIDKDGETRIAERHW